MDSLTDLVTNVLRGVADPCGAASGVSVVEMGIVHSISKVGDTVHVQIKPTTGLCPHTAVMMAEIKAAILGSGAASQVEVNLVRDVGRPARGQFSTAPMNRLTKARGALDDQ